MEPKTRHPAALCHNKRVNGDFATGTALIHNGSSGTYLPVEEKK